MKLYLKGERCYTDKCAISRRGKPPGQHGGRRIKLSSYGIQLREKQKVKRYYGILETQFRNYYEKAANMPGITGENFLRLLESRLDNVVYRLGFASSRKEARQLVRHGHFTLNGHKADIPSIIVNVGDVVEVKEKSKNSPKFKELKERSVNAPKWLEADMENLKGKVVAAPTREDIDLPIEEHLIVELYSK
jgi:small subunit ribosomal protein S4